MGKSRRRMALSVAVIAIIAGSYLSARRGDTRFVGRWEDSPTPDTAICTLQLDASGTGWIRENIEDFTSYFEWEVRGAELVLSPPRSTTNSWWTRSIVALRNGSQGQRGGRAPAAVVHPMSSAWSVDQITSEGFRIMPIEGRDSWILGSKSWSFHRVR